MTFADQRELQAAPPVEVERIRPNLSAEQLTLLEQIENEPTIWELY